MCRLKQHGDGRALADLAFQLDAGVVDPGNVLDDGQPQAGAAGGFAPALIHPVKPLTTGEGGMIVTDNEEFYQKMMLFRSHGFTRDENLMTRNDGPWFNQKM